MNNKITTAQRTDFCQKINIRGYVSLRFKFSIFIEKFNGIFDNSKNRKEKPEIPD
jgi:hypothetical protein